MQDTDAVPNLLADEHSNVSLIVEGLIARGFNHEYFWLNNESYSRLTKPGYRAWVTRNAHLSYPMTIPAVSYICKNKSISYQYAQRLGITTPYTHALYGGEEISQQDIDKLLNQYSALVVKPADLAQSRGLTLNIKSEDQLQEALSYAREFSDDVLIQNQIRGQEARFFVFKGAVKSVLLRQTPQLVGDGASTLKELLDQENTIRSSLSDVMVPYPALPAELIVEYKSDMRLSDGEIIELSRSTLIRSGASIYDILSKTDHSYIDIAQKVASHLGAQFIVIDLMMHDYTRQADANNYALIEFNELPSLKLCYSCRDGSHYDILQDLLPLIEEALKY